MILLLQFNIPERKFSPLVIDATDQPYYTDNIFPQWSADGKTLTFSSKGYSLAKNNIWVMENFLPKEETSNTQK